MRSILIIVSAFFMLLHSAYGTEESVTTSQDQLQLSMTIYNNDLALIRDKRLISLPAGEENLAFKEISSQIIPETAVLKSPGLRVIEQNFEYDLLTPMSLLKKYVNKYVDIVRVNPVTGEEVREQAKVLSSANGAVVLKIGDRIETEVAGRIIYPDVPDNLRDRPTLTMLLESKEGSRKEAELSYLTRGLNWRADYVAELNESEDRINLLGWVTLNNNSGVEYRNASLQLVAGEVNQVSTRPYRDQVVFAQGMDQRGAQSMTQEPMFEYHLYTVARPTTVADNQSKQISLLREDQGLCRKEIIFQAQGANYYLNRVGEVRRGRHAQVVLEMKNDKASGFGLPKPAGIVRVYKSDSRGAAQFVGEDRIGHTPENEVIRLNLGESFDITGDWIQKDYTLISGGRDREKIVESEYVITVKNGKAKKANVVIEEALPGEWQILDESHPHTRSDAIRARWSIVVPPQGKSVLNYRVRIKMTQ